MELKTKFNDDRYNLDQFYNQYEHTRNLYSEYSNNKNTLENYKGVNVWIVGILIGIGILLCYSIVIPIINISIIVYMYITNSNEKKNKINRNNQIKQIIHDEYQKTNQFVHIQYASPFILDKLRQYMDTGRCQSLGECINLYEQERQTAEQTKLLNNMNKKITNMAYGVDYLAYSTFIDNIF